MATVSQVDLPRQEPLWTSSEHPVVCWPKDRSDDLLAGAVSAYHSHPDFEATVVLEGEQELIYADARLTCGPGDVWFAAPGEAHGYRSAGVANICLAFSPTFLGDTMLGPRHWLAIYSEPPERRPTVQSDSQRASVLEAGWRLRREADAQQPGYEAALRVGLAYTLLLLVREWTPASAFTTEFGAILPAIRLTSVRAKAGEPVPAGEAALACAMSRSHFSRAFSRAMGRPFERFEIESRLAVAARLLVGSDAPVGEVAAQTGFWDSGHLSRHFVPHFGVTPRRYRAESRPPRPATSRG